MSDKIVIKYTKDGVVQENLATKETQQLTTSEWGSQIRYEKQNEGFYNKNSQIDLEKNNDNISFSKNNKSKDIPTKDEYYEDLKNANGKYFNKRKSYKAHREPYNFSSNYKNKKSISFRKNDKQQNKNITVEQKKSEDFIYTRKKNEVVIGSHNIKRNKNYSTKKEHKNISTKTNYENSINEKHESPILKGLNTNNDTYSTSYGSDVTNITSGGVKGKFVSNVKKSVENIVKNKSENVLDKDDDGNIAPKITLFNIIGLHLMFGIIPIFILLIILGVTSNTVKQMHKTEKVVASYIKVLDRNFLNDLNKKIEEDKKQPNTEVIVENKEVIGTMTKQISAIAMNKIGFVTKKLSDDNRATIRSIHNLTYEYSLVINNENGKITKKYKVTSLALDDLFYQMGLSDKEKQGVQQILAIIQSSNKPEGGGDIPPSNPGGFANPLKAGTYSVSQWYTAGKHNGIDLAAGTGTAIYASADGVVRFAGYGDGNNGFNRYGNCVFIDHQNGLYTLYAHASALYVSVGQTVKQGQHIAGVGNTGQSYGSHLHFEVRSGLQDPRENPSNYINF